MEVYMSEDPSSYKLHQRYFLAEDFGVIGAHYKGVNLLQ